MTRLSDRIRTLIADAPAPLVEPKLSQREIRIFRALKTEMERSTKGRAITSFEALAESRDGNALVVVLSGPHAYGVARQIARRFEDMKDVRSAEVFGKRDEVRVHVRAREE